MAEETGFEPAMLLHILAFQASALDHYATLPNLINYYIIEKGARQDEFICL